ncbi:MAG TPA: aminopeptidase P N-terminal domain-containing protein [Polyangia bacterium]|nr:aminopeptidase P N-terminal domain-containing protein [Polyangia bacterium]
MESPFARRRDRLLREIGASALVLLPGATMRPRNGDASYRFRQDSDFWYLTGFDEPDAVALLAPGRERRFLLFVRPRDPEREVWDGRRAGVEGATRDYGADEAFPIAELDAKLPGLLENVDDLYFPLGRDAAWDIKVTSLLERARSLERRGVRAPRRVLDPRELTAEMRLRKEPVELAALARAAAITVEAHQAAMRAARDGTWEYEIEAEIEHVFRRRGARGPGYTTIVGAGANATILHYVDNRSRLEEGQLLLVDAGAEFDFYTADVTRTVPVGGRFRRPARRVYDAVLEAQQAAIARVRAGATLDDIHAGALEVLVRHLYEMKVLAEPPAEAIEKGSYKRYYMHRTSHWLGLDVHDAGSYRVGGGPRPLEPGFVLTVEPGLYFAVDDATVPEEYRGLGVRIEDDVLVTAEGAEVLTAAAPKRPADLEKIVAR